MSKSAQPWEQPDEETKRAARPIEEELKETLRAIDSPEKAEAVVEQLIAETNGKTQAEEAERAPQDPAAPPAEQAAIAADVVAQEREAAQGPTDEAARVIQGVAQEATALEGEAYEALVGSVQEVTNPALADAPTALETPRRYLRDAIMNRMSFFQRYDTAGFLAVNNLPHPPAVNRFFHQLSFWFNGGWGWLLGPLLFLPFGPSRVFSLLRRIAVPTWAAALVVEGPVKKYFRRKRPFISVVQAIVVGKKPGNWSFPSGHASAAFGGARMMHRFLPKWAPLWYSIAFLIGFSRIYLGAHYPGDVLSGSIIGVAIAEGTRTLMDRWGILVE